MKTSKDKRGYLRIYAYLQDKRHIVPIHRLVAKEFVSNPNPEEYDEVNHIDGDRNNNDPSNLEWCTGAMNIQHAFAIGLMKPRFGKDHPLARRVGKYMNENLIKEYSSMVEAVKEGHTQCGICEAIKKDHNHRGHKWKYID